MFRESITDYADNERMRLDVSARHSENFWSTIGTVVTTAGDLLGGGDSGPRPSDWYAFYSQIIQDPSPCPGQPSLDATMRAVARMPQSSIERILEALRAGNEGFAPASRDELAERGKAPVWIKAVMGGNDCQNKSASWLPPFFKGLVETYGGSEIEAGAAITSTGGLAPSGSVDPTSPTDSAIGGVGGGNWLDQLQDYIDSIGNAGQTVSNTADTIQGGITGAQAGAGAVQAQQRTNATLANLGLGNPTTVIAIAAGLILLVVLTR